jgi:hypothetical protein
MTAQRTIETFLSRSNSLEEVLLLSPRTVVSTVTAIDTTGFSLPALGGTVL